MTTDTPLLGFGLPVSGSWAGRDAVVKVARRAEELGYASLWDYQRTLWPADGRLGPSHRRVLDPVVALAVAAGHTERIGARHNSTSTDMAARAGAWRPRRRRARHTSRAPPARPWPGATATFTFYLWMEGEFRTGSFGQYDVNDNLIGAVVTGSTCCAYSC